MQGLVVLKKVIVNFTADQWDLYTSTMDCTQAANALNKALETAVNSGLNKQDTYTAVDKVRGQYSEYGAADSEPRYTLEHALGVIFGKGA